MASGPGWFAKVADPRAMRIWGEGAPQAAAVLQGSRDTCHCVRSQVRVCNGVAVRALGPGHGRNDSLTKGVWRQVTPWSHL